MKNAREEFGPPAHRVEQRLTQNLQDLKTVRDVGQQLKQSGVTQDQKQANLTLVKNDQGSQSAHKDMGVAQGERPALSPCDGKLQQASNQADIKQAGQALQNAGVKQSAAQQFAPPAQTPSVPPPSQGRSR